MDFFEKMLLLRSTPTHVMGSGKRLEHHLSNYSHFQPTLLSTNVSMNTMSPTPQAQSQVMTPRHQKVRQCLPLITYDLKVSANHLFRHHMMIFSPGLLYSLASTTCTS